MTDRIKGFYVSLERDVREDDCEPLIQAVRMLRGVGAVTTVLVDASDWMNRERATRELETRLWDALRPERKERGDGG